MNGNSDKENKLCYVMLLFWKNDIMFKPIMDFSF